MISRFAANVDDDDRPIFMGSPAYNGPA